MTNAQRDGMRLMLLGSLILILIGSAVAIKSTVELVDFRVIYFPARCLLQNGDPYNEAEVLKVAKSEGGERPADVRSDNHFARYIYPPSTFSFTVPLALMPWRISEIFWMVFTGSGIIVGAWLIWSLGADYSPLISSILVGFLLANCELLMVLGNSAGIAIALCAIALWCFFRDRFIVIGVFCLAMSLAFKPHDTGLVWLYLLLSGGIFRKRALQSLLAIAAISLPGTIWVWYLVPNWIQELHSNMAAFSAHGGLTDPSFASAGGLGLGMMVNLQTVFSSFWSNENIYNAATYLVCGPLLLIWAIASLRFRFSPASAWLALAAIAPLALLPIYHRQYDTKLLLLTVPGCAMLWAEGGVVGWVALILNSAGFFLTGDLSWIAILALLSRLFPSDSRLLSHVQVFSVPLILLLLGSFYLWVYLRRNNLGQQEKSALPEEAAKCM